MATNMTCYKIQQVTKYKKVSQKPLLLSQPGTSAHVAESAIEPWSEWFLSETASHSVFAKPYPQRSSMWVVNPSPNPYFTHPDLRVSQNLSSALDVDHLAEQYNQNLAEGTVSEGEFLDDEFNSFDVFLDFRYQDSYFFVPRCANYGWGTPPAGCIWCGHCRERTLVTNHVGTSYLSTTSCLTRWLIDHCTEQLPQVSSLGTGSLLEHIKTTKSSRLNLTKCWPKGWSNIYHLLSYPYSPKHKST